MEIAAFLAAVFLRFLFLDALRGKMLISSSRFQV